ncbi:putative L-asparaginase periplasmic precursor [Arthrobacter saudimassiliensis]|uniref:Putative L-asparaginase periplasmic n=1 Tax=Arthrobacter saudimassiliensis TaxID=1461584 RepID=A0A078MRF2_9MICC|nr:putative L-asparaginase periplasmic precursor [Arthrobacter saudimassiliensis]
MTRIAYCSLGGTISSTSATGEGAVPSLGAAGQLAAVPIAEDVSIEAHSLDLLPSVELTLDRVADVARFCASLVRDGVDGIVLSTGTDALEDVAWALHLTWDAEVPLIVTGAMRAASAPSADGPGNVADAIAAAASASVRGLGVLVCFAGELHGAAHVAKAHSASVAAFTSPGFGPLGLVSEGSVRLAARPAAPPPRLGLPTAHPPVALLPFSLGDDGRILRALPDLGFAGVVVQGFGAGHVSTAWAQAAKDLAAAQLPVVLASRASAGPVFRRTYGFPGSEQDLLGGGLIDSGFLGGHRSRLLLAVLLGNRTPLPVIREVFAAVGI